MHGGLLQVDDHNAAGGRTIFSTGRERVRKRVTMQMCEKQKEKRYLRKTAFV